MTLTEHIARTIQIYKQQGRKYECPFEDEDRQRAWFEYLSKYLLKR